MVAGPTITMLGGGIGCSRLAVALAAELDAGALSLVVNTADDLWQYGLRICPDLDTNLYALAGLLDTDRGWGLSGDTFDSMDRLRQLGCDPWFGLGDVDLATHLFRTGLLADGLGLTAVTDRLAGRCGIATRLLPMTDVEVGTLITVGGVDLSFQEWFVKRHAEGPIERVSYEGIDRAEATPAVHDAIVNADLVVIAPSSPVASIDPILTLPGIRHLLAARRSSVVAVTPIVGAVPIVHDREARRARARAAQMRSRGLEHSAAAVAGLYAELAGTFVLDRTDAEQRAEVEANNQEVVLIDTIIGDAQVGKRLAETVLGLIHEPGRHGDRRRRQASEVLDQEVAHHR
jgi:LPPG:FO 2-phospho-L-lactate transferase